MDVETDAIPFTTGTPKSIVAVLGILFAVLGGWRFLLHEYGALCIDIDDLGQRVRIRHAFPLSLCFDKLRLAGDHLSFKFHLGRVGVVDTYGRRVGMRVLVAFEWRSTRPYLACFHWPTG